MVDKQNRREFLNFFLGGGFLALLGAVFYPVLRFVMPPAKSEAFGGSVTAAKTSELPPNSGKIFPLGDSPGLLVHTAEGEYKAFSAVCTHLSCTVQYRPDLGHIWCACHNGHYDLTGKNVAGPPPRPLTEYPVTLSGDNVIVSTSRGA
jgi:Rieske Fe-S protein